VQPRTVAQTTHGSVRRAQYVRGRAQRGLAGSGICGCDVGRQNMMRRCHGHRRASHHQPLPLPTPTPHLHGAPGTASAGSWPYEPGIDAFERNTDLRGTEPSANDLARADLWPHYSRSWPTHPSRDVPLTSTRAAARRPRRPARWRRIRHSRAGDRGHLNAMLARGLVSSRGRARSHRPDDSGDG